MRVLADVGAIRASGRNAVPELERKNLVRPKSTAKLDGGKGFGFFT